VGATVAELQAIFVGNLCWSGQMAALYTRSADAIQ
jgi:hypothetical protein